MLEPHERNSCAEGSPGLISERGGILEAAEDGAEAIYSLPVVVGFGGSAGRFGAAV